MRNNFLSLFILKLVVRKRLKNIIIILLCFLKPCMQSLQFKKKNYLKEHVHGGGGDLLPILDYMRRLCLKGVPF